MTPPPTLHRKRALARAALWWEGAWLALWPVLGVLGLFCLFALLGIPALLPGWLHALALLGFALVLVPPLRRAVISLRTPGAEAADRRLERASGLKHRPLAALQDRPATEGTEGAALWAAHQSRMAALVTQLRVGLPRPGLAARDRMALRGGLLVALAAALGIAGADAPALLARGLAPQIPGATAAAPLRLEAWITPPAYTGAPPIFLDGRGGRAWRTGGRAAAAAGRPESDARALAPSASLCALARSAARTLGRGARQRRLFPSALRTPARSPLIFCSSDPFLAATCVRDDLRCYLT
jgi:hypothetical protein